MDEYELYNKLKNIFEIANKKFVEKEVLLFEEDVNERCLCAQLVCYLKDAIKETEFNSYYVDAEYNRNKASISKKKEIISKAGETSRITCDLIVHSRGENIDQDNLIALEMKKKNNNNGVASDKERLISLTKQSQKTSPKKLPEYVDGYILGIFYLIDNRRRIISLEYYFNGEKYELSEDIPY